MARPRDRDVARGRSAPVVDGPRDDARGALFFARGVGWAICYENPSNGRLSNHWITLHEIGNVAGFTPALVMDVWEHAFLLDYKPAERPKYIEAFFSNIDWNAVEQRLKSGTAARQQTA